MRLARRIQHLERSQPAVGTCAGCGHGDAYRVRFRDERSEPHRPCPACGDRSLIVVEFIDAPMPSGRGIRESVFGDADGWIRGLNLGATP